MLPANAVIFLSGRLVALVVLLTFQVVLVRVLPAAQYAIYALVFGFASLMQTAVSLGIPRVISKYMSQAGWRVAHRTIRRLAERLLLLRIAGSTVLMAISLILLRWAGLAGPIDPELMVIGGLFILSSLVQMDADSMAQALMQQRVSRACTVGEASLRLTLVSVLAHGGHLDGARGVLLISLITSSAAAAILLIAVFKALAGADEKAELVRLDRKELIAIALSSYASSMAWFASSPAIIRMIASRVLAITAFAGFAFCQSLVVSFQRYTPGLLIFPFLEPAVMKHFARTGNRDRLESALSLIIKIDMIFIGAAIVGTAVAGPAIVAILTGGKYAGAAYALPWLLIYITTSSIYKSFEIVAVALGASQILWKTLTLSLFWLAAAILLAGRFGMAVLLLAPVGDTLSRLALMYFALGRIGVRHIVDVGTVAVTLSLIAVCGLAGAQFANSLTTGRPAEVAVGVVATLLYMGALVIYRPFRVAEMDVLAARASEPVRRLIYRLARRQSADPALDLNATP